MKTTDEILFSAVGDVGPNREDPGSIFQWISPEITKSDIAFCQLETNLSERGDPSSHARLPMRAAPKTAGALRNAGFNIISFASNHCLDWGRQALFDTIENIRNEQICLIGAGRNIDEARQPAIVKLKGNRIAVLAFNSILPSGYSADKNRPGCAPVRAITHYEQIEKDQPGTPCHIHTFACRDDLRVLTDDIKKAKDNADIVILSLHSGVHFVPAIIADYQKEIARQSVDSGADMVLCHHAHILKGIEVYKKKVIFYGLGNFAIENPASFKEGLLEESSHKEIEALNPNWNTNDDYILPPETRNTFMVNCRIKNKYIRQVSILPGYINSQSEPEFLKPDDARFHSVLDYIKKITSDQALSATFTVKNSEVIITE